MRSLVGGDDCSPIGTDGRNSHACGFARPTPTVVAGLAASPRVIGFPSQIRPASFGDVAGSLLRTNAKLQGGLPPKGFAGFAPVAAENGFFKFAASDNLGRKKELVQTKTIPATRCSA